MKKLIITLDVNGTTSEEAQLRIPRVIADQMGFDELKAGIEHMFLPVAGIDVVQIEMVEEVRHQMQRRWDDVPTIRHGSIRSVG